MTEPMEGKMHGTPRPASVSTKQDRIAKLAEQMPDKALYSLANHVDLEWMREAHQRTRKDGAKGVDGQTADEFAANLDENLMTLINQAKGGTYRAPPVRRVHIPKGDGSKTRPIGIPTFADKVMQRAVAMLLEPIYEQDFYDFSYGFRPGRSAHDALEALDRDLRRVGGGWVLDVDIKSFFDTLDHKVLRDLLRQRVTDGVVVRLVGKWLRAGVLEGGVVTRSERGTPQGGVISPLLANIYLHEVLDKWWVETVVPRLRDKRSSLVRYADDFVCVFPNKADALRVQAVLSKRFARFGLTLHPDKTRLVEFTRPGPGGGGGPGSFDFLGFTMHWGRSRRGRWYIQRKTAKGRFSRALRNLSQWMRAARHVPIDKQARTLSAKLRGHFNYYGLKGNSRAINRFRFHAMQLWFKWLGTRSQRAKMTWEAFNRLIDKQKLPTATLRGAKR